MYIVTDDCHFVAKNFVVQEFYGEETCFCWNEDKLVTFPHASSNTASLQILKAPAPIKKIQCFSGRVFLICAPQGIYKLSKDREFAVLSKSAVGMGTVFYEVLTPVKGLLSLYNKQDLTSKQLFPLSTESQEPTEIHVFLLSVENSEEQFLNDLASCEGPVERVCIIADGRRLFILVNETVRIIYNSTYPTTDIVPVRRGTKIAGLLLTTDVDRTVLVRSKEGKPVFREAYLGTKIVSICASFSRQAKDTVWFVYSDDSKLYYAKEEQSTDAVRRKGVQDKSFACLRCYDSKVILGLTTNNQLLQFSTDAVEKTVSSDGDTFINLCPAMLKGSDVIMDKICQGVERLDVLNQELLVEQDKLRKINLYAHRRRIRLCPKMSVHRISDQIFLSVNFQDALPKHSRVVLSFESEGRRIFCTKTVSSSETVVDLRLPGNMASKLERIAVDLITLANEGAFWCLIKNYIIDPAEDQSNRENRGTKKSKTDRSSFISGKIATLKKFIEEGSTDFAKLSEIKKSIRDELTDS